MGWPFSGTDGSVALMSTTQSVPYIALLKYMSSLTLSKGGEMGR